MLLLPKPYHRLTVVFVTVSVLCTPAIIPNHLLAKHVLLHLFMKKKKQQVNLSDVFHLSFHFRMTHHTIYATIHYNLFLLKAFFNLNHSNFSNLIESTHVNKTENNVKGSCPYFHTYLSPSSL